MSIACSPPSDVPSSITDGRFTDLDDVDPEEYEPAWLVVESIDTASGSRGEGGRSGASMCGREVTDEEGDISHFSTSSDESRRVDDGDVLRDPPLENVSVWGLSGGAPLRRGIESPVPLGGCGMARGTGGIVDSRVGVRGAKGAKGGD